MGKFERQGIFKGVRILDFTIALAGVFNAWQFADHGADVWKIEKYGSGDQCRLWGPFVGENSALYASFNRNKRSIEVNLRSPEGKAVILELVKHCDLVLENFKAGTLEKLGLGYEELSQANPKIVYGSLSGFGTTGPLWKLPCYDLIASARGGLAASSGEKVGAPLKPGFAIGDNMSGVNFFHATTMGLYNAKKTGKGCRLEVAMMDTCMQPIARPVLENSLTGSYQMRNGDHDRFTAPNGMYEVRDGYAVIVADTDEKWATFCDVMDLADLKADPRFATNADRVANLDALIAAIEAVTTKVFRKDLEAKCIAAGVPAAGVLNWAEVLHSQQIKDEGSLTFVNTTGIGQLPMIVNPVHFSKTPGIIKRCSPQLGEDSQDILEEAGFTQAQIDELVTAKAVGVLA